MKRALLLPALLGLTCCSEQPDAGKSTADADAESAQAAAATEAETIVPATPRDATRDRPFVNSLQMEFVPVPETNGVLMCVTETRIKDFRAYVEDSGYVQQGGAYVSTAEGWFLNPSASWENPGFAQGDNHPVSCVNWEESRAFCAWMTEQDREAGLIGANDRYRLPKDEEWSLAAGMPKYPPEEEDSDSDADKEKASGAGPDNWLISGYRNPDPQTSPVGSYPANRFGFYDLGGNVWEWCEDRYRASMNDPELLEKYDFLENEVHEDGTPFRVLRGISWYFVQEPSLLFSLRNRDRPTFRNVVRGFRLSLVIGNDQPAFLTR